MLLFLHCWLANGKWQKLKCYFSSSRTCKCKIHNTKWKNANVFLHPQLATGGKGLRPHARLKAAMLPTPLPGSKCSNAQMFKMVKCLQCSKWYQALSHDQHWKYISLRKLHQEQMNSHHDIASYRSSTTTSSTATCGSKSLVTSPAFTLADPASYF